MVSTGSIIKRAIKIRAPLKIMDVQRFTEEDDLFIREHVSRGSK